MLADVDLTLAVVRGMARSSALLFSIGTLGYGIVRLSPLRRSAFIGLCITHAVHYSAVTFYLNATMPRGFLWTGRFFATATFGAVMYSMMVFLATRKPASSDRHILETICVVLLGTAFMVAYIFRSLRSIAFLPMLLLVLVALAVFVRGRVSARKTGAATAAN